ncbi:trypsin-like serine protease [Paracoccus beibuensis]|uniref:trypsin-like serine protease n=1 Tax=Paracoccus beibuensis TaxID=547602 RepID=UPI002240D536|nr:trypsin-like serine protease [Paracoccus beibuensis]
MFRFTAAIVLTWAALGLQGAMAQDFYGNDDLTGVTPRADPALVQALVDNQHSLGRHGIDTRLRVSHFLAQVMTETGGLRRLDENMNYSANRLTEVFSRRVVTPDKARQIAGQPEAIANWVYRNRLGNGGPDTGDGWAYRGSGYIQLTGRTNYRLRGEETGLPLEMRPDMVRQAGPGLEAATAYWTARRINPLADLNDRPGIRRLVNGPRMEGLDQAILWHNRIWTGIYTGRPPFPNEDAMLEAAEADLEGDGDQALRRILIDEGFVEAAEFESGDPARTQADALREYQESRGLPLTGVLDDDTFYAITDPSEWRGVDEPELAALSAPVDADRGVSHRLDGAASSPSMTALEPNEGSGVADAEPLDADEAAALGGAGGTYSAYETAEGRHEGGDFIPFTVIGDDDRQTVLDTTAYPSRAVVQILFRKREGLGQNLCSGAMVAPDLVLTAGHCVHGGTAMGRWYTDFEVFPGRNTGAKPFGTCRAVALYALQGWTTATLVSDSRLYDLGAIKLDCAVGERTGWFGIAALPDEAFGRPSTVQGYAADKSPPGRQWISFDRFRALEADKGFYENDTFGGTSGSPVFTETDYRITCVHTNGLHGSGNWGRYNACTRVTPQRLQTIIDWIEE